jgi:hypothetical protein
MAWFSWLLASQFLLQDKIKSVKWLTEYNLTKYVAAWAWA